MKKISNVFYDLLIKKMSFMIFWPVFFFCEPFDQYNATEILHLFNTKPHDKEMNRSKAEAFMVDKGYMRGSYEKYEFR